MRLDPTTDTILRNAQHYAQKAAEDLAALVPGGPPERRAALDLGAQVLTQAYIQIAGARKIIEEVAT